MPSTGYPFSGDQRKLFKAAKNQDIQAVTNNSEVQIVCRWNNGKAIFRPVHTMEGLNNVSTSAMKSIPSVTKQIPHLTQKQKKN